MAYLAFSFFARILKSMNYKSFLWPLPFLSFLGGYYLLSTVYTQPTVTTPALVGSTLMSAIETLSTAHLTPRILAQKEDPDLPDGLILSQTPAAHQQIKIGQPVYLVISQKPADQPTPNLIGKTRKNMARIVRQKKIHEKLYEVPSPTPLPSTPKASTDRHPAVSAIARRATAGSGAERNRRAEKVIGQFPSARMACIDNGMIIYYPESDEKIVLMPDLRKKSVLEAKQFLNEYGIKAKIEHIQTKKPNHTCTNCRVVKQKPPAKAFIDLNEKLSVTLWVN